MTLCLSYFLGFFGADRFYLGKTGTALFKLFTFGGFGYWWIIDVLITLFGGQRDQWGLRLRGYAKHRKTVWIVIGAIFVAPVALGIMVAMTAASVGGTGPTTFGWMLLAIAATGAVAGCAIWFLRRHARVKSARAKRGTDPLPARIRALVSKLTELRAVYIVRAAAGDPVAATVIKQIDSVDTNVVELFARLTVKADKDQRTRAEAEYEDKLRKVAAALDRGYLLDVLANPRLWDEPDQRARDVQSAIEAVDAQLLENVRQVNARRGLEFKVAIDELIPRKALDDWQREFDRASGAE